MKTIVWIGPDRLIPPYGSTYPGDEKDLPDDVADSFVKQKLAKFKNQKVSERTVTSKTSVQER